jgi:hypothetical protein
MGKEFVPYELGFKLKQLGFDEPCLTCYDRLEIIASHGKNVFDYKNYNSSGYMVSRPTFSQAFRWFREKYNIHSFIIPLIDEVGFVYKYQARVHTKESAVEIIGEFETCEEAELACLEKLIEIVEQIKSE